LNRYQETIVLQHTVDLHEYGATLINQEMFKKIRGQHNTYRTVIEGKWFQSRLKQRFHIVWPVLQECRVDIQRILLVRNKMS
jgi:hypothetical protein